MKTNPPPKGNPNSHWLLLLVLGLAVLPARGQQLLWISPMDSATIFSSPRAVDLNGDGKKEVIVGGGQEDVPGSRGVYAFNPVNGQTFWTAPARNQVYGSAIFHDITGDSIPDVFMVGREAQLFALDGTNGHRIWDFWPDSLGNPTDSSYYNFYNPQFVPDQNADGVPDLVVTNGGNAKALATDTLRPPGWLMLVSGADGALIAKDTVPDLRETYHSPLIRQNAAGQWEVLWGTGGERIRGHYYRILLQDLRAGNINGAEVLATDSVKGFICPPALVDLTSDARYDMVLPTMSGRILALEGENGGLLWEVAMPGFEGYVSPVIGQFTGDATPDVFVTLAKGLWPFYSSFYDVLIDGATGAVVRTDSTPFFQLAAPNVLDWDNDGMDEVLLVRNFDAGTQTVDYNTTFRIRDFNDNTEFQFGGLRDGISIFSTPLLTDVDGDGLLDWIVAWNDVQGSWNAFDGGFVGRVHVGLNRAEVPWGSYLGTYWDGTYRLNLPVRVEEALAPFALRVYPNPTTDRIEMVVEGTVFGYAELLDAEGHVLLRTDIPNFDLNDFAAGCYFYRVHTAHGVANGKIVKWNP